MRVQSYTFKYSAQDMSAQACTLHREAMPDAKASSENRDSKFFFFIQPYLPSFVVKLITKLVYLTNHKIYTTYMLPLALRTVSAIICITTARTTLLRFLTRVRLV